MKTAFKALKTLFEIILRLSAITLFSDKLPILPSKYPDKAVKRDFP
jgi:hypothetical protein